MINGQIGVIVLKPIFSHICLFFIEQQINKFVILLILVDKLNSMFLDVAKVLSTFLIVRGSQPFVILHFPGFELITFRSYEIFIVFLCEEGMLLLPLFDFYEWCDEFFQEFGLSVYQTWPKMMHKVNNKSFYMGTISILICHDHNAPISKRFQVFVLF